MQLLDHVSSTVRSIERTSPQAQTGKTCRDSMSGEGFESTVIVTLNDKTYLGCGLALH